MDNFQIETAQNISIRQNAAGIGERILAFLIDTFILVIYMIFAGVIISGAGLDQMGEWVYYLVLGIPVFLYYLLWEALWNGRTPGKAAMKLRVVKLDGSRPVFSHYLLRWLLRLIDISFSSGAIAVLTVLLNGKGQRLGDVAAGTTVISEVRKVSLAHSLGVDLPENYQPVYPQVQVLNDKDVQTVKNIFDSARRDGQQQIIINLSEKLSRLIEVTPGERPVDFVKQVISDYNYYTSR